MNRRQALATLGLSAAAAARPARAATPPRGNFLYVHTPNGFYRPAFGADPGPAGMVLRPSLAALVPYQAKLAVVSGLCNRAAGAPSVARLLTCASGPEPATGYGRSIDGAVAALFGGRPLNTSVLTPPGDPGARLSWDGWGRENLPIDDVVRGWDRTFGAGRVSVDQAVAREARVRQALAGQFVGLQRRLPRTELDRMAAHLRHLARVQGPIGSRGGLTDRATLAAGSASADVRTQGRLKIDLITAALASGFRRSATLLWQPAGGGLDPTGSGRSHQEVAASGDAAAWSRIDAWYAGELAYLLERLTALELLDETVVCWGSEVSQLPNQNNMTFVLAGGSALRLRNGLALALPFAGNESDGVAAARRPGNRPLADLWLTLLGLFGVGATSFGDFGANTGPLSGLTTPG